MGKICPECGTYQPIRRNLTLDDKGARKADEVYASELACGHVVGGEEYERYITQIRSVEAAQAKAIAKVQDEMRAKKAALTKAFLVERKGE